MWWFWGFFYFSSAGLGSIIYQLFQIKVNAEQHNPFLEVDRKYSDILALKLSSAFRGGSVESTSSQVNVERKRHHSNAFCRHQSFHCWRTIPSGDVQCSCGRVPACWPILPVQLRSCQTMNTSGKKKIARIKKKVSASHGNDSVLNFLLLAYRELNVAVQAVYWKRGL